MMKGKVVFSKILQGSHIKILCHSVSKFLISVGSYIAHFLDLGPWCITMSYSKTQPPDFPPKGSGHVLSNFLLSAGILAQYKTFHVSFKQYL